MSLFANGNAFNSQSGTPVVQSLPTNPKDKQVVIDYSSGTPILKVYDASSNQWVTQGSSAPVGNASEVSFNKTNTTFTFNNVQEVLEEIDDKINNISSGNVSWDNF